MVDLGSGKKAKELLEAQAHVVNYVLNYSNSMALKCAIQLGIPDAINRHAQPMSLSQLVTALSLQPSKASCLYRLMQLLVHSGFFQEEEEGFSLTPASRFLLKDEPFTGVPLALLQLNPNAMNSWQFLSDWFHNDDPTAFHTAYGKSFWDYAASEPKLQDFFNDAMASDSRLIASALITACKERFQGLSSLIDVGGGTGTMGKAIAEAFPHLNCTVFDLPHVVANLEGGENLQFVGGDMFEAIPPANAVILKWILHNWSDEECVKILKKCREAIPTEEEGGKLMIIDMVMENKKGDHEAVETQFFWDMLMMVTLMGKERNEKEWEKLFLAAGFSHYKIIPVLGFRSLIEVYP